MSDNLRQQILAIRNSGETNMFNMDEVKRIASREGYHELVCLIEENSCNYTKIVLRAITD